MVRRLENRKRTAHGVFAVQEKKGNEINYFEKNLDFKRRETGGRTSLEDDFAVEGSGNFNWYLSRACPG